MAATKEKKETLKKPRNFSRRFATPQPCPPPTSLARPVGISRVQDPLAAVVFAILQTLLERPACFFGVSKGGGARWGGGDCKTTRKEGLSTKNYGVFSRLKAKEILLLECRRFFYLMRYSYCFLFSDLPSPFELGDQIKHLSWKI